MVRIWFNHWFSTAYNIIKMIKDDIEDAYIIGSNENRLAVISAVCDEWYEEPVLSRDEYVDFCLKFCRDHKVDIFMPRRGMLDVSRRMDEFVAAGIKVCVEKYEIMDILNHKDKAYEFLKEKGIGTIPDYYIVTNAKDFKTAYEELKKTYKRVCFKFVHDEGGKSYRLIDNERKGYAALFKKITTRMTFDEAFEALSEKETFAPLMVMPNLPDEEISVDCLYTDRGYIMLPRVKGTTRVEKLEYRQDILEETEKILEITGLRCPCNVQFKYLDKKPYFLEINTRMSGGVQMACHATGVNIPALAIRKMLGREMEWELIKEEKYVTHVENPVLVGKV